MLLLGRYQLGLLGKSAQIEGVLIRDKSHLHPLHVVDGVVVVEEWLPKHDVLLICVHHKVACSLCLTSEQDARRQLVPHRVKLNKNNG